MESLIGLIFILIVIFIFFLKRRDSNYYREYRNYNKRYNNYNKKYEYQRKDITEQRLHDMETGNISTKKIMNIEETKIFYSMVKAFKDYNVHPQVSFKAFLKSDEDSYAWRTFRDFYCDYLITYKRGNKINEPVAVIEYHGKGHFGDTETLKEKVKNNDMVREKLFNKMGLKYFIIKDDDIKINSKFIDETKLDAYLCDIYIILNKQ